MIELTKEQHETLVNGETRVHDPQTNVTYVLVGEETYQRWHELVETGPLTPHERQAILRGVWERARWDDPRMDAYDALPEQP